MVIFKFKKVCNGNGVCVAPNLCNCNSNYYTSNCSVTQCYGVFSNSTQVCSSSGTCSSFNNCTCNTGYSGNNCQFLSCFGINSTNPNGNFYFKKSM